MDDEFQKPDKQLALTLLNAPLYQTFTLPNLISLRYILAGYARFDAYCVKCGENATFHSSASPIPKMDTEPDSSTTPRTVKMLPSERRTWFKSFEIQSTCTRENHLLIMHFKGLDLENARDNDSDEFEEKITKVGQWPAMAEMHSKDTKRYEKVLGAEHCTYLHRAIQSRSFGLSVGAYAYYRKVFEKIVKNAEDRFLSENKEFKFPPNTPFDKKFDLIKEQLPDFIRENKSIYGLLSKGLHGLSEENCRIALDPVSEAIYFALEDEISKFNNKSLKERISKYIQNTNSEHKGK